MSGEFTFTVEDFGKILDSMLTLKPKQLNTKIDKVQRMIENSTDIESEKIVNVFEGKKSNGLKRGRNSWQIFLAEQRKNFEPGLDGREQLAEASKLWANMSEEDKKPYIEAGKKESADYKAQKDELSKSSNDEEDKEKSSNDDDELSKSSNDEEDKEKSKPVDEPIKSTKVKYDNEFWGDLEELNWTRYENDMEFWEYATNDEKYIIREGKMNGKVKISDKIMKSSNAIQRSLTKQIEKKESAGFIIVA